MMRHKQGPNQFENLKNMVHHYRIPLPCQVWEYPPRDAQAHPIDQRIVLRPFCSISCIGDYVTLSWLVVLRQNQVIDWCVRPDHLRQNVECDAARILMHQSSICLSFYYIPWCYDIVLFSMH